MPDRFLTILFLKKLFLKEMSINIKEELSNNTLTLEMVLDSILDLLKEGTEESASPFHTPVISSVAENKPSSRIIVLRRFDKRLRRLIFHTDRRSSKVKEINDNPNLAWLFYDSSKRVQLRIDSTAVVLTNGDLFEEQWNSTQLMSKRCYTIREKPGSKVLKPFSGIPDVFLERRPTIEETNNVKINFAVIAARIKSITWLFLKSSGNISAEFLFEEEGIISNWIIP